MGMTESPLSARVLRVPLKCVSQHHGYEAALNRRTPAVSMTASVQLALVARPIVAIEDPANKGHYLAVANLSTLELLQAQSDSERLKIAIFVLPPELPTAIQWSAIDEHLLPYLSGNQDDKQQRRSRAALRRAGLPIQNLEVDVRAQRTRRRK